MSDIINFTIEKLRREAGVGDSPVATLIWPYDPEEDAVRMTPIELALNSFLALPIRERVMLMEWYVTNRVTEPEPPPPG
jgi:hypothetical protein